MDECKYYEHSLPDRWKLILRPCPFVRVQEVGSGGFAESIEFSLGDIVLAINGRYCGVLQSVKTKISFFLDAFHCCDDLTCVILRNMFLLIVCLCKLKKYLVYKFEPKKERNRKKNESYKR